MYKANPVPAPSITSPGESKEYVGTRDVTKLLPVVLQTPINRKFLESTLEQLMTSGSLQAINSYVGTRSTNDRYGEDFLNNNRVADTYQFVPGVVNRDSDGNITNTLTYDDLINALEFNEVNINNVNTTLNEKGYTLDIPINYDMFVNFHRYHWLVDELPICDIRATSTDPIVIDDILDEIYYTTPTLSDGNTLTFENGMRIRFAATQEEFLVQTVSGNDTFPMSVTDATYVKVLLDNNLQTEGTDYNIVGTDIIFSTAPSVVASIEVLYYYTSGTSYTPGDVFIVDGVGSVDGIKFTKQFEVISSKEYGTRVWLNETIYSGRNPSKFDADDDSFDFKPYDVSEFKLLVRDYVVEERFSPDQSAWSRSNLWIHEEVAASVCAFCDVEPKTFIRDDNRAVRPIIEYRSGMKKYDFGERHIENVTHILDTVSNPASQIVGQAEWDLAKHTITDEWSDSVRYHKGDMVKVTADPTYYDAITYWDCIQDHIGAAKPTHYENQVYWRQVTSKPLANGDTILFLSSGTSYDDKIWRVGGVDSGSITLTEIYNSDGSNGATELQPLDKVLAVIGYNSVFNDTIDSLIYSGSEWYWSGTEWIYGQQKDHKSEGALYHLYDRNGVELSDYTGSQFVGDIIFGYRTGTGVYDEALGFSPKYVDYGNNPGLEFSFGLGAIKYPYTDGGNEYKDIPGDYFYKNYVTGQYHDGWVELRGGQRIFKHKQHIVTGNEDTVSVPMGTTDFLDDDKFRIRKSYGSLKFSSESTLNSRTRVTEINGSNPSIFVTRGRPYSIQTYFDVSDFEIVGRDGLASSDVIVTSVSNTAINFEVDSDSNVQALTYRLASDSSVFGTIYVIDETDNTTIQVYVNGTRITDFTLNSDRIVTSNFQKGDTLDFYWYTDGELTDSAGNFEVAGTHEFNPQNGYLEYASFGDLVSHIQPQMESIPGFVGSFFGSNNYRALPHIHEFGGTIRRQPYSTEILSQVLMDTDTNLYSGLKYLSQSYRRFLGSFVGKCRQLHKQLPSHVPVHELVDRAFDQIHLGKNKNTPFSNSDMVVYSSYECTNSTLYDGDTTTVLLPNSINTYADTSNHIQVWVQDIDGNGDAVWRALIKDVDYTLSRHIVTITSSISYDSNGEASVHIRWYPINSVSFMPPSAAKLGLVRPHLPEVITTNDTDSDGNFTGSAIIGHDGSVYSRNGTELFNRNVVGFSVDDAVLWELETRIYNNLSSDLDDVIDYKNILPTANRPTSYTWDDLREATQSEFNKWKTRNNIGDLQPDEYYDPLNKFTWNYRSVSPYIGGYRGIYNYYFNTDTPHLTPWKMFGYNKKPAWWDANYSWTDTVKRAALIEALRHGHYNDPADTYAKYNISYAYPSYDWDSDILVTTTGVLNDPITAGIVDAPVSVRAAKPFVYGDWGPVEHEWRVASESKMAMFVGLLRLRPLWITNNYFKSSDRKIEENQYVGKEEIYYVDTGTLDTAYSDLTYSKYSDSIIETIVVKDGGSGYTSTPAITIESNFGDGATATAIVDNGSVVAVSVDNPGNNYQSKPTISISGSAILSGLVLNGAVHYYTGLSNVISEYSRYNQTPISDIVERFNTLSYNPVIKASGFINQNSQNFILESSQDKGKVAVPEENYVSFLHVSQPRAELFYGAVTATKLDVGFMISGFDNSNQYFEYHYPNKASQKTVVNIDSSMDDVYEFNRYKQYEEAVSRLYYNNTLLTMQDVYDFVLGYGEFLNRQGWTADWTNTAARFVIWAISANVGDTESFIPNVSGIQIADQPLGYYDNLNNKYDGVYNIIGKTGQQILPSKVVVSRDYLETFEPKTTINVKDIDNTEIYGLRLYNVTIEHAVVFDKVTSFDDLIYEPELGVRHRRIIWNGSRTKDWNGKLYSPGYVVNGNTIVNNLDTTAREIDKFYNKGNKTIRSQIVDVSRFNTGYNEPDWASHTVLDQDTVFEFTQGTHKYRGTRQALDSFMRNTGLFDAVATADLYEEWAVRLADYGDTRSRNTLEFQLSSELLTSEPQPVRFVEGIQNDTLTDDVVDIDSNSSLMVTGNVGYNFRTRPIKTYTNDTFQASEYFGKDMLIAGLPLTTEVDYMVSNRKDFEQFPEETHVDYNFSGKWQSIDQWDNKTSYKYKDRVMYDGRVWEMLDPDGSSGLQVPYDPIFVTGTIDTPIISADGGSLIFDGTTVNIRKSAVVEGYNIISVVSTNDISTSDVVEHTSTLILGKTLADNTTITFDNTVPTIYYYTISKTGTVLNPTITGSASARLTIDGVYVEFSSVGTVYTLTDIVDEINAASIPRVTASDVDGYLVLSKTPIDSLTSFSMTITSDVSNADVGFNIITETINSQGVLVDVPTNLSISQVVEQINLASIEGVAARIYPSDNTLIEILSSNTQLYIGAGSANSVIGLTVGTTPATTTVTTEYVESDLSYIIEQINAAGIDGLVASDYTDRLRLTSTNPEFIIGAGTENETVGLIEKTYEATQTIVSNEFNGTLGSDGNDIFQQVANDPHVFNIWVADDSEDVMSGIGYSVYQTMDFGFSVGAAYPGDTLADDAVISVARPSGYTQAHTFSVGDYVLIRGSNTSPSIDGIRRVTKVDGNDGSIFEIDTFITSEGDVGNIYPLRNVRFASYSNLVNEYNTKINGIYTYKFTGIRRNLSDSPIYAFVDDNGSGVPAVYMFDGTWTENDGHTGDWVEVRTIEEQTRNDLIENIKIYDATRKSIIATIEVFDPVKGIFPGFIDNEIDFRLSVDIASYNYDNISGYTQNEKIWGDSHVGVRWWDIATSVYIDYEQSNIKYRQSNWGRLFPGSSVDIYEWTKSPVLPEQWQDLVDEGNMIDGVIPSGEALSTQVDGETVYRWTEQRVYNPKSQSTETSYFFWVKNKTTNHGERAYNIYQLSRLLSDVKSFDITWAAASSTNTLLLSNISRFLTDDTVIQVNQKYDSNALTLDEWVLLRDGDPECYIPEYFHMRMRDSISGYNKDSDIHTYTTYDASTTYSSNIVVKEGDYYYLCISDNTLAISPSSDTGMSNWIRLYDYSFIDGTQQDDIAILNSRYVPDYNLHKFNRYGHTVRPRQSLIRDVFEARQNFTETLNSILQNIVIVTYTPHWETVLSATFVEGDVTYNLSKYWNYVDYVDPSYEVSDIPDMTVVDSLDEITTPLEAGMTVYVRKADCGTGDNPEIYRVNDDLTTTLVWKKRGTIRFSDELWDSSKFGEGFDTAGYDSRGYDSSIENIISKLFDVLRNDVFIREYKHLYNVLWFSCLNQAVAQNTTDDFAFKTSYVKMNITRPLLLDKQKYQEHNTLATEEYFKSIKPFHTKLGDVYDTNTYGEYAEINLDDSRDMDITMVYNDHSSRTWDGDVLLSGGTFTTTTYNNVDASTFTTPDEDFEYIYRGHFVQPVEEGWGKELYPIDFVENIRIAVQTNRTGSMEDTDTRSFIMNHYHPSMQEENTVIVDSSKAELAQTLAADDIEITVVDSSMLTDPANSYGVQTPEFMYSRGIVWVNGERIEYGAIDGNVLKYCIRGTWGTLPQEHASGSVVIDSSWPYRIPTTKMLSHYHNDLRLAFNDWGVSLADTGNTREHNFIRNSGAGTV